MFRMQILSFLHSEEFLRDKNTPKPKQRTPTR